MSEPHEGRSQDAASRSTGRVTAVNHYLYALVDRMPAAWQCPSGGIGGSAVVPQRVDDVVVLGSIVQSVPQATPRTLALHHDVVGSVMDAAALVPFHYGATVPFAALPEWVSAPRAEVGGARAGAGACLRMSA